MVQVGLRGKACSAVTSAVPILGLHRAQEFQGCSVLCFEAQNDDIPVPVVLQEEWDPSGVFYRGIAKPSVRLQSLSCRMAEDRLTLGLYHCL